MFFNTVGIVTVRCTTRVL